ncbi:DUF4407 domain-containing protein [Nocardia paucivorans]|uniref:DUF4407 domain-containing protein n=1 Tax=Nocardia paucivorans TaxID=114259 RepID=UPI0002E29A4C|nr:DUF4407 domain-containing protein [Nocardia paucivorans]
MTVAGMFVWLGGGQPAEPADGYERTGYLVTGASVTVFALVAAGIAMTALGLSDGWPLPAAIAVAVVVGFVTGLIGRTLAGAEQTGRPDLPAGTPNRRAVVGRITVAALMGILLAELAATVLFDGTIDRLLDERAATSAAATPEVRLAHTRLDRAVADRAALDRTLTEAETALDEALIIARCEYHPTPQCPQTKITGVPGRGPEARTAETMLDDARARLRDARTRITPLDQRIADARGALDEAEATAIATADRGFGARWAAMHDHTVSTPSAFILRLLGTIAFVLFALLPLVLRWWRGETTQERRRAAAAVRDRAERAADAAIAEKQAQLRAEAETLRAEQQLAETRLAAEADTAIAREQQRTRIIAAIGGLEIGVTESPRRTPEQVGREVTTRDRALPVGDLAPDDANAEPHHRPGDPAEAPAAVDPRSDRLPDVRTAPPAGSDGLELPLIGIVPFSDTAVRLIRPLVPSFVTSAIDTASRPLRTARQVLEEAEEITFTLRRTRAVTMNTTTGPVPSSSPESGTDRQLSASVVDITYPDAETVAVPTSPLTGEPDVVDPDELSAPHATALSKRPNPPQLPPGH